MNGLVMVPRHRGIDPGWIGSSTRWNLSFSPSPTPKQKIIFAISLFFYIPLAYLT